MDTILIVIFLAGLSFVIIITYAIMMYPKSGKDATKLMSWFEQEPPFGISRILDKDGKPIVYGQNGVPDYPKPPAPLPPRKICEGRWISK